MGKSFRLPAKAWFGDEEREIIFPDSWAVEWHGLPGDAKPVIGEAEVLAALRDPIGAPPVRETAARAGQVAIVFDDITRPTPTAILARAVLAELAAAGVPDERIRFVCALGAHGAHTRLDFEKKLGREVIERFPVYNHNPYENLVEVGKTESGAVVLINAEVMACDLRIGLGAITPHPFAGYGGGNKLLLPGVAGMDTITQNHLIAAMAIGAAGGNPVYGLGNIDGNAMRRDIDEAVRMIGGFFAVNVLVNSRRGMTDVFAGDPFAAHAAGVEAARPHYVTPWPEDADVIVVNANAKASEAAIALLFGAQAVKPGGDVVLVVDSPIGQMTHYLLGSFGRDRGGRFYRPPALPAGLDRAIILTGHRDYASGHWFGPEERLVWRETWDDVLALLVQKYPRGGRAAIFVDGTIMNFPPRD